MSKVVTEFYRFTSSHLITLVIILSFATGFTLAGSFYAVIEAKEAQTGAEKEAQKAIDIYRIEAEKTREKYDTLMVYIVDIKGYLKSVWEVDIPERPVTLDETDESED